MGILCSQKKWGLAHGFTVEGLTTGDCTGRKVIRVEFCQHKVDVFPNVNSTTYVQIHWIILGFCKSICMYKHIRGAEGPSSFPFVPIERYLPALVSARGNDPFWCCHPLLCFREIYCFLLTDCTLELV